MLSLPIYLDNNATTRTDIDARGVRKRWRG